MTAKPDKMAALVAAVEKAAERGAERGVSAALDRHLPGIGADLSDDIAELLRAAGPVSRRRRRAIGDAGRKHLVPIYPARDAAAWIEAAYGRPPRGGSDEAERKRNARAAMNLWRWRTGRSESAERDHVERVIRACGGDPADLPDELPVADDQGGDRG